MSIKVLNSELLKSLIKKAKINPRLRQHYNLHDSYDEPSQRILNAMEPGSYLRPHRHLIRAKPESFVGIRGRLALVIFYNDGQIDQILLFGPGEDIVGVDIPEGIWHTVVSLEEGSVFYETKPGPFVPLDSNDMAPWAPNPDSPQAALYLSSLRVAVERSNL